ncbi:HAD family hydrolase [Treponema endosymbiont of Eucomonympha sp.]|uniref:HAD family hydrolase n=1 Tax=Treponema endosymbiont of Eucomonympha sp. TaxID=1580831 RepID=UPI00075107C4|nr:HAD family phosphatase [Treponema endosymbiont of Eucomonympha sp.]
MIKAVIFDYGNVISLPQSPAVISEMEKISGVPASLFASVYDKYRFDFDRGLITGVQLYAQLLKDAGYDVLAENTELMQQIVDIDMENWNKTNPAVTEWGLALKQQGYKLGILSNIPTEFLDRYEKEIALFAVADYACFSCHVNAIKPEEVIYRDVIAGLKVEPCEAVFFDDLPQNIEAANRFGLHGVVWTGLENAKKAWKNLNRCNKKAIEPLDK